jgi:hypothetical protein
MNKLHLMQHAWFDYRGRRRLNPLKTRRSLANLEGMLRSLSAILVLLASGPGGHAEAINCRGIPDSLERLRCYDTQADQAAAAERGKQVDEDPLVAKARELVKRQLRDPDSAQFRNFDIKTIAGRKGLCGQVNAKNGFGGLTGFLDVAFDGEYAWILIFNAGAGNPTSMSDSSLGASIGSRLKAHEIWCARPKAPPKPPVKK